MKILSPKMRDIKQLLTSAAGCDRIADYNFRSTEEVAAYVGGLGDQITGIIAKLITASKFTVRAATRVDPIPGIDLKQLKTCYDLLGELQHKLEILQSLEVTIAHNFRNNREKLGKEIRALQTRLESQRDKALNTLERMAADREPQQFRKIVDRATANLQKSLKKQYRSLKQYSYVTSGREPGSILFNHYVEFSDLVNGQQDYVYPEYYIVFSASIDVRNSMRMFVNSLHEFRAPGQFNIGQEFANEIECGQAVNTLMIADEFIDKFERPALLLKQSDVRVRKMLLKNVQAVELLDNKLRVTTGPTEKTDLETAIKSLCKDVTGLLLPHNVKGILKYKLSSAGQKRYNIDFVVVPTAKIVLDANHEQLLRTRLGMNDDQIKGVRKLLDKGYV